jgi:hypothetical protein
MSLIQERQSCESYGDLNKSKGDVASLAKYKKAIFALQNNMKALMAENEGLKKKTNLTTQRDSTVVVLGVSKIQ